MTCTRTLSLPTILLHICLLFPRNVFAHSWIDCIDTDRSVVYDHAREWIYGGTKSNGICAGYIENYPGRGDADINTKMTFKILKRDVQRGSSLCPSARSTYSSWRKRLQVTPGQTFYFGYLSNGHVVKDKAGRGTYYGVYWTGEPDTFLNSTTDISDERLVDGELHDFDDGNCGQSFEDGDFSGSVRSGRAGNDYPCVGQMSMPRGTRPGIYNLVWLWKFYHEGSVDYTIQASAFGGAAYTSCFQVEVLPTSDERGSGVGISDERQAPPTTPRAPTEAPRYEIAPLIPSVREERNEQS